MTADSRTEERIQDAFGTKAVSPATKHRMLVTIRASAGRQTAIRPAWRVGIAAVAVLGVVAAFAVTYLSPLSSPTPAMAAMVEGLRKLDCVGVVHYKVTSKGTLTEKGKVLRRNSRTDEYWIDSERRLARWETKAPSGEAAAGLFITADGVTYSIQTNELNGQKTTSTTTRRSGRDWSDDFDGTIQSLIRWIEGGSAKIVERTRVDGQEVFIVRVTWENQTERVVTTESETFWLRRADYVPLKVEYRQGDTLDGRPVGAEYVEVRSYSEYEHLAPKDTPADLFAVPR